MAIVLAMAVTIEVARPFRLPIGCPFGLLLVFLTQHLVTSVGQTVRVVNFNDLSRSFIDINTFYCFCTFAQLDKTFYGIVSYI